MCRSLSIFYSQESTTKLLINDIVKNFFSHFEHLLCMLGTTHTVKSLIKYTITYKRFSNHLTATLMRELIHNNLVPINHLNKEQTCFIGKIIANLILLHLLKYSQHIIKLCFTDFQPSDSEIDNTFTVYWLQNKTPAETKLIQEPFQTLLLNTLDNIHFKCYFEMLVWIPKTTSPFVIESEEDFVV